LYYQWLPCILLGYSVKGYRACPICEEKTFKFMKRYKMLMWLLEKIGRSKLWLKYGRRDQSFYLSYWCKLDVRHCIDVMHVEKNVCDSLIKTLINIKGKVEDVVNAHLNLIEMNIWEELAPWEVGKCTYLPAVCYTLSKKEKSSFCDVLKVLRYHKATIQMLKVLYL